MRPKSPPQGRQPITVKLAKWSAEHPWRSIGMWVVFVVVCLVVGGSVAGKEATELDYAQGESGKATKIVHDGNFDDPAQENIVITSKNGTFDNNAAQAAASELTAKLGTLDEVAKVDPPATAPKGSALLVTVTMRGDPDAADERVQPILDATKSVGKAHPELRLQEAGDGSLDKEINGRVADDLKKAEKLSLPITLIILLVAFGAIIAAGVPVLLAMSAVGAAMGLSGLASYLFPAEDTVGSVILLMGMAVGVDYSLFYLKREREERAKGKSHLDAVEIAAATSGRSVVVSGLAVIVSAAGLYLASDVTFSSLATGMIIVVAVAVLGSLTVLPALLAKLGRWVDRPKVPFLWRLTTPRGGEPRLWPALLRPALRRPALTLFVSVAALLALAAPALTMNFKSSDLEDLPRDLASVAAYKEISRHFPSENLTHEVAVKATPEKSEQVQAALRALAQNASTSKGFASVQPAEIEVSKDKRVTTLKVVTAFSEDTDGAKDSLRYLRSTLAPPTIGEVDGADYAVGGDIAENLDNVNHLKDALPWVMGFVLVLTFVMMVVTFRSVVVALTAIVTNLVSALAAFGVLVLVFQRQWAEGLLDFNSSGAIVTWIPLFLFVVLFGLSMDYHVFVVSRIKEAAARGLSTTDAVREGITRSAGVVSSAAIVMVAVFAIFATLSLIEMKELGVGLSVAILIDAVVIRIVVLPSVMALLGRANWWPGRMSRKDHQGKHAEDRRSEPAELTPAGV